MTTQNSSPMSQCAGGDHEMRDWPEGIAVMAAIADSAWDTSIVTEPEHCMKCGSMVFVLRGAERIYVPRYESGASGPPIRRPITTEE